MERIPQPRPLLSEDAKTLLIGAALLAPILLIVALAWYVPACHAAGINP